MGCAASKQVKASVAAEDYQPPPTSIAVFDINTIEEPWLITTTTADKFEENHDKHDDFKKPMHVTLPILDKLESTTNDDLAPQLSWSEVSKALQDLKPTLEQQKTEPMAAGLISNSVAKKEAEKVQLRPPPVAGSLKENCFIVRDRLEREGNKTDLSKIKWRRPDPFEGYQERVPPGNAEGVVLYTTSLRGVRRTFEDCEWARRVVYPNSVDVGIEVDERDVSLHGEFLKEVRELVGESGGVPRLFIMGRYVGGIEEIVEINERGKLREMMRCAARRGGKGGEGKGGWVECEGCGGTRFVPCLDCNGSCKVLKEDVKEVVRCDKCNENGLMMCPLCH